MIILYNLAYKMMEFFVKLILIKNIAERWSKLQNTNHSALASNMSDNSYLRCDSKSQSNNQILTYTSKRYQGSSLGSWNIYTLSSLMQ